MDAQLKKGVLDMCILHSLKEKEMYGYEIMKIIKSHFHDIYEGTIYTILRRLAADNLLESYIGDVSDGPQRKYYRITEKGRLHLEKILIDWLELYMIIKSMGIIDET